VAGTTYPTPLPAWLKAASYLGGAAPAIFHAGEALFEYLVPAGTDPTDLQWCHVIATGTRSSPTGTTEDLAQITFDIANITDGAHDPTWTSADLDHVTDALAVYLAAVRVYQTTGFTWKELRYYMRRFKPLNAGFEDMGDPVRIVPVAYAGTASATTLPYQVALSVTEKTVLRKHWGRFYLPCPAHTTLDGYGRWTSTVTAAIAALTGTAYEALISNGLLPVVASAGSSSLLSITQVQVDDIPDVQRSRRARTTLIRSIAPIA